MTPTATRMKLRLDERRRWFHNQWLFKGHGVGRDGSVDADTFDGGYAHYSGIGFAGSLRQVYWDALLRGVRKEISEQFSWLDVEVRNYNHETALRAIDECAGQIVSFVRTIRRAAVEKDRILRGDGITFPQEDDAGHWGGTSGPEIQAQADALKAALPIAFAAPIVATSQSTLRIWWDDNQGWLGPTSWIMGAIGMIAGLVAFF